MGSNNSYPLITKKEILRRLGTDPGFVREAVGIIHQLYLARCRKEIERGGWMASQASTGTRLAEKFAVRKETPADVTQAATLLRYYARALAAHFRSRQLLENPALAEVAALFGVVPQPAGLAGAGAPVAVPVPVPAEGATPAAHPPGEERARPKGFDGRVLAYVTKHPGARAETIAAALDTKTADVSPALRRLTDAGWVRSEGRARGTTYWPVA
jgi:hypothetical protein